MPTWRKKFNVVLILSPTSFPYSQNFYCNNLFQSSNLIGRAFQTMTFCITPFVCAFQIVRLWWGISACYIFMPIDSDKWLHNSWSHFQTNKLSAWPTSTYCKICIRKFFTLTWNSQSHGFLLKLFDFACKKTLNIPDTLHESFWITLWKQPVYKTIFTNQTSLLFSVSRDNKMLN